MKKKISRKAKNFSIFSFKFSQNVTKTPITNFARVKSSFQSRNRLKISYPKPARSKYSLVIRQNHKFQQGFSER